MSRDMYFPPSRSRSCECALVILSILLNIRRPRASAQFMLKPYFVEVSHEIDKAGYILGGVK
jgi:hypothetical protein